MLAVRYFYVVFSFAIIFCQAAFAQETTVEYKPVAYPDGFSANLNVVYTTVNGWEGKMDLYLPLKSGKPSPMLINIHGGGWNHGVKESQTGFSTFFKEGFAVANIEYRLTGQATAPAAIEDARCALVYILLNAKELNIDVNRIVLMGGSAGGHLALMAGLLGNNGIFDTNCKREKEIKVAAIIDKYGITDVGDWAFGPNITSKSATNWLGSQSKNEAFIKSVSPVYYVSKSSPPVFIVHGDADPTVPYQQSVELHKKLLAAGVQTEFVTIPGGLHGKFDKDQNSMLNKAIINFLKSVPAFNVK